MTVTFRKKSKAERGDTLTLRISSKDKFALELLAQKNDSTLSYIVMEALRKPLKDGLTIERGKGRQKNRIYVPDIAYDPLLPDRLVKLSMAAPKLLSDRQQVEWKIIQENSGYWTTNGSPEYKKIRDAWDDIQKLTDEALDTYAK